MLFCVLFPCIKYVQCINDQRIYQTGNRIQGATFLSGKVVSGQVINLSNNGANDRLGRWMRQTEACLMSTFRAFLNASDTTISAASFHEHFPRPINIPFVCFHLTMFSPSQYWYDVRIFWDFYWYAIFLRSSPAKKKFCTFLYVLAIKFKAQNMDEGTEHWQELIYLLSGRTGSEVEPLNQ